MKERKIFCVSLRLCVNVSMLGRRGERERKRERDRKKERKKERKRKKVREKKREMKPILYKFENFV